MSSLSLYSDSTLTKRYQTTIPNIVRKALGLEKHDKIRFTVQSDGNVLVSRANQMDEDPVLERFLTFLTNDININPKNVKALDSDFYNRAQTLVSDVEIDINSPLSKEDK